MSKDPKNATESTALARTPLTGIPTDDLTNGKLHLGLSLGMQSGSGQDAQKTELVVEDAMTVGEGKSAVYLSRPMTLKGAKLEAYLKSVAPSTPEKVLEAIKGTDATLGALYVKAAKPAATPPARATAPANEPSRTLLMSFALDFQSSGKTGLLASLVGPELGELFDITSFEARVFQCGSEEALADLKDYVQALNAPQVPKALPAGGAGAQPPAVVPPPGE